MDIGMLCDIQKQSGAYRRLWIRIFKSCETWRLAIGKCLQRSGNELVTAIYLHGISSVKNSPKTWVTLYQSSQSHIPKECENFISRILFTARRSFHSCNIKLVARRISWRHWFLLFRKGSV